MRPRQVRYQAALRPDMLTTSPLILTHLHCQPQIARKKPAAVGAAGRSEKQRSLRYFTGELKLDSPSSTSAQAQYT